LKRNLDYVLLAPCRVASDYRRQGRDHPSVCAVSASADANVPVHKYASIACGQRGERSDVWIADAIATDISDLRRFALGLLPDKELLDVN
jgi:hypothetical protein